MKNQDDTRAIEILAKTVYRDLKQAGYGRAEILSFASNILGHLTDEAKQPTASSEASVEASAHAI